MTESKYGLCKTCVDRQGGNALNFQVVPGGHCFICGGLMERFEDVAERVRRKANSYEFATFGVGLSMPEGVQEREDEIRSAFQLKGKQTVKGQLSALLSARLAEKLKKRQSRTNPDLMILVDVSNSQVTLQSKPLFYFGRYTKPTGVAQRRELCKSCWGQGCESCGQTGFDQSPSVEEKVGKKLTDITGARAAKFTWIGSEDLDSVVCGTGRPFVVELKSPRTRRAPRRFLAGGRGGRVRVTRGKILPSKPTRLPTFRFRTRIFAKAERKVAREEMRGLAKAFRRATVVFDRPNERPVLKTVYSARGSVRGRRLVIEAELDGGLPIKRFVSGDLVSPSISQVLKTEVKCDRFDICGVKETGEFGFG